MSDSTEPDDKPEVREDAATGRERRTSPRNALLMTGRLYQRGTLVNCVVSNISASGAKLLLPGPATEMLPDSAAGANITLTVPRFGDFPARLVWVKATGVGIDFLLPEAEIAGLLAAFFNLSQSA